MLFNSFEYLWFLPTVFLLYWFVFNKNLKLQNLFLLIVSYIFYGWWDWRFLTLIAFSSLVDYNIGLLLANAKFKHRRKLLLAISIMVNLGLLGYFKYCNFFIENFVDMFNAFGINLQVSTLRIILPVGISFYTFQTMSYTIDVYRGKLKPTNNAIQFFAYVSFFPQLVAGPIERAVNLLPQFEKKRQFNYEKASDGVRQIIWGLFKKVVIADNCAVYVNQIFDSPADHNGLTLALGAVLFAFQIYGDFSGYSDIAIGTAKLFGFDLMKNFATPYFSRDIAEFWRRWHISLSTWFRDYLYIPLGGSRGGMWMKVRNTFIIFLVSGFWHGANWTFIIWGFLNALYFLPLLFRNKNRQYIEVVASSSYLPSFKELMLIIKTFILTTLAWVFFRADTLSLAVEYIVSIFNHDNGFIGPIQFMRLLPILLLFIVFDWMHRNQTESLICSHEYKVLNTIWVLSVVILILWLGNFFNPQEFIYFDF
ncbi:MBOAT family O-acyltransferase [Winogradskyella ouciana]|uniref:MBOAT family protein n=1 Tax=Winogradskyella ouciana TaxID=2608631 RepID=A0A7K1GBW0_9FLAO|nr:MBOAT family O-acyltransferase [Winogradskyella ouciana]MTE26535.1 MBOAT family protein [Winogradskyella ouciana]